MTGLATKVRTAWALGPGNIARVALYRAGLRSGLHPVQGIRAVAVPGGPCFAPPLLSAVAAEVPPDWTAGHLLFGHMPLPASEAPPDWHLSPLTGRRAQSEKDWWLIGDFDPALGDIKPVWEMSRMAWLLPFAQGARNGSARSLELLNGWIADWLARNPPYKGVNWKCGQEASIRVMHLAAAAHILGQLQSPGEALTALLRLHLARIEPTLSYARAQDNNHGTSEAAALFIGGLMLGSAGARWSAAGRAALEERVARLVMPDGTFSQYSLVYHRLMLDTLALAEIARRAFGAAAFSSRFAERARAAADWLQAMIDPASGEGPNSGANDGALILPLTNASPRDFRPSLQLSAALFADGLAVEANGDWDDALLWLGVARPAATIPSAGSRVADAGGFAVLRKAGAMAMLRYPRFRFRPGQADALHADLWVDGQNLLMDAGSYSYNADAALMAYFSGTEGHNTVQFDGRNQMPRLGRFLFGDWLETEEAGPFKEDETSARFSASYRDRQGASHRRTITLTSRSLRVEDEVSGFRERAVLRWRLSPRDWELSQSGDRALCISAAGEAARRVLVTSSESISRARISQGLTSRHYLEKEPCPVLEVETQRPSHFTTLYEWPS